MSKPLVGWTFILSLGWTATATAQALIYELVGASDADGFGRTLAAVGDLDGDGHADLAVGASQDDLHGSQSGRVVIYSGATGDVIVELHGNAGDTFGSSVARAFDIDDDGFGDVLIGAPNADGGFGEAYVYALPSGSLLDAYGWIEKEGFGIRVAGLGDVNGDGVPDLGIETVLTEGLFAADGPGCLYAYSGAGVFGTGIATTCAPKCYDAAGDVDGDGFGDYLRGSWGDEFGIGPEFVQLRGGSTQLSLDTLVQDDQHERIRAFAGRDFDGDGRPEYLFTYRTLGGKTLVEVRKLAPGEAQPTVEVLFSIRIDSVAAELGDVESACIADVNGDGMLDVVLGFPDADSPSGQLSGAIRGYDGLPPHDPLFEIYGENAGQHLPSSMAVLGDLDGDGSEEFAAGDPAGSPGASPGRVLVFSNPAWLPAWSDYGPPLVGMTVPHLAGQGLPAPNSPIALVVTQGTPSTNSFLVVGTSPLLKLFKGGFLAPEPELVLGPFLSSASGELSFGATLPPFLPPGMHLYFQVWFVDPSGFAGWTATNGVHALIQP